MINVEVTFSIKGNSLIFKEIVGVNDVNDTKEIRTALTDRLAEQLGGKIDPLPAVKNILLIVQLEA